MCARGANKRNIMSEEVRYPGGTAMSTNGWRKDRGDETEYHRRESRRKTLEAELLADEPESTWADAHHVVVVSRAHHIKNIESSDELLRLLITHHGLPR